MNWRRLPGVVYQHKIQAGCAIAACVLCLYALLQTGIVCSNNVIEKAIQDLCYDFYTFKATGSLCRPLCEENLISSISCIQNHAGKHLVFRAKWDDANVVIKSAYPAEYMRNETENQPSLNEESLRIFVHDLVKNALNVSVTAKQIDSLVWLQSSKTKNSGTDLRSVEIDNLQTLLQSREYLLSVFFADQDVFPQLYGTCGHMYAVEYLQVPRVNSFFMSDSEEIWWQRMNAAVLIMELLEQLETNFPDPMHLCDIKLEHFGVNGVGRLKVTDLDDVHTDNVLQQILSQGQSCQQDSDCDLFDCKSSCNSHSKRCDSGLANSNLQVICEKIFIGYALKGKMIVPGLLMSEHTPPSLAALLRQCAENGRTPVPEDIRQRLYTTLTEMEQIIGQKLHST